MLCLAAGAGSAVGEACLSIASVRFFMSTACARKPERSRIETPPPSLRPLNHLWALPRTYHHHVQEDELHQQHKEDEEGLGDARVDAAIGAAGRLAAAGRRAA
jgi:hypothetical protein